MSILTEILDDFSSILSSLDAFFIGLFGSYARNKAYEDLDILIIDAKDKTAVQEFQQEFNGEIVLISKTELEKLPALTKYALSKDLKPIKGDLNDVLRLFAVSISEVLFECQKNVIYYFWDAQEEFKDGNLLEAARFAFEAQKYVIWYILAKNGQSLPNNSNEMITLLSEKNSWVKTYLKNTLLYEFADIFKIKALNNDLIIQKTLNFIKSLGAPIMRTLNEIEHSFEKAKKRIEDAEKEKDYEELRIQCQRLFLIFWDTVDLFFASIGESPGETHVEKREKLRKRGEIDSNATFLLRYYEESFSELRIECHYKGLANFRIVKKWIPKIETYLEFIKTKLH